MIKPVFEEQNYNSVDFFVEGITRGEYDNCLFTNCNFSELDFSSFSFIECWFVNCNLSNAIINNAVFCDVILKGCKLLGLQFNDCNESLFSVVFDTCQPRLACFYKRNIKNCNFINCQLQEVDFVEANLSGAKLINCDQSNAVFDNTNLEKADLSTSYNFTIDPDHNKINKAIFASDQLIGLLRKYNIVIR